MSFLDLQAGARGGDARQPHAADSISPELVALLWQLYEHRCVVLFSGPTGAGKTTLTNYHSQELLIAPTLVAA